jgi:hypothetical protein
MTDPGHAASVWTDRSFLRDVQYKTDVNLATRQSIYAYQEPPVDLARAILSLAGLSGHEVVADIGCGNRSSPTCGACGKPPACPTRSRWSKP